MSDSASVEPKSSSSAATEELTASDSGAAQVGDSQETPSATGDAAAAAAIDETAAAVSSSQEPKNVQELTNYIQGMLQQMQDRFQVSEKKSMAMGPRQSFSLSSVTS